MAMRIIPLPPTGKPRPNVTRRGGVYYPAGYDKWRADLRLMYGPVAAEGFIRLTVVGYYAMPKSWSKRKRAVMVGAFCDKTPDLDNMIGAIMDALFENDARVVASYCEKRWAEEAAIGIDIEVVG